MAYEKINVLQSCIVVIVDVWAILLNYVQINWNTVAKLPV